MPLLHTSVQADLEGPLARTTVQQKFQNPSTHSLELTYLFPLPHEAAVGHYRFRVGSRTIEGQIQTRDLARQHYERARAAGQTAALLEQQRPNVFLQRLTNIPPGATIEVTLQYDEWLPLDDGQHVYVFPMVVGPRFMGNLQERLNPTYSPDPWRSGTTIDLCLTLKGSHETYGAIGSPTHELILERGEEATVLRLRQQKSIPNRDFVLHYAYASSEPTLWAQRYVSPDRPGKDTVMIALLPPHLHTHDAPILPREFLFLLDVSGSMHGAPLELAKATLKACLSSLRPQDRFQIFAFASSVVACSPEPLPPTSANLEAAFSFMDRQQGGGGTQLLAALQQVLQQSVDPERLRLAVLFSDGYIGNEADILRTVTQHKEETRFFGFGIGSSVNRYFMESLGPMGGGHSDIVLPQAMPQEVAKRWERHLRTPLLTDLQLTFHDGSLTDLQSSSSLDLFAGSSVFWIGKQTVPGPLSLSISGNHGGRRVERFLQVNPSRHTNQDVLQRLWARKKMEALHLASFHASPVEKENMQQQITELGLAHRLMSEFTSFVAVDSQSEVPIEGRLSTDIPVPLPEAMSAPWQVASPDRSGPQRLRSTGSAPAPQASGQDLFQERKVKGAEIQPEDKATTPAKAEETTLPKNPVFQLERKEGSGKVIGIVVTGRPNLDLTGWWIHSSEGTTKIALKRQWFARRQGGVLFLDLTPLNLQSDALWILVLPDGSTYQFSL
jgi:Ca-activated chloride channel family protein